MSLVNTKGFNRMGAIRYLSIKGMKWEEFCCGFESSSTTDHCNKSQLAAEASNTILKQLCLHPCNASLGRAEFLSSQPGFRLSKTAITSHVGLHSSLRRYQIGAAKASSVNHRCSPTRCQLQPRRTEETRDLEVS